MGRGSRDDAARAERPERGPVHMPGDDAEHMRAGGDHRPQRDSFGRGDPEPVERFDAREERRMVHREHGRREVGRQLGLEPFEPLGREPAVVEAGPGAVERDHPDPADLHRVAVRVLPAEVGGQGVVVVVVPRQHVHRQPERRQELARPLVLAGGARLGHVAGHQDRVRRRAERAYGADRGGGRPCGRAVARPDLDVEVGELREQGRGLSRRGGIPSRGGGRRWRTRRRPHGAGRPRSTGPCAGRRRRCSFRLPWSDPS